MKIDAVTAAIHEYLLGERREMYAILAFSVGLVLAVLLSSTAVSLLLRDPPHEARLVAATQEGEVRTALAAEEHRMAEVIRKYPLYRNTAMGLGLVALIAVVTMRQGSTGTG